MGTIDEERKNAQDEIDARIIEVRLFLRTFSEERPNLFVEMTNGILDADYSFVPSWPAEQAKICNEIIAELARLQFMQIIMIEGKDMTDEDLKDA